MLSEQQLVERLESIGYKGVQIREALRDVGRVIVTKTAEAYLGKLPTDERTRLKSLSEDQVQTFLAERQPPLSPMPQEEFEKIHDETWEDYFSSVA